jgi:hypothetical protein
MKQRFSSIHVAGVAVLGLVVACKDTAVVQTQVSATAAAVQQSMAAPACPTQDLQAFVAAFAQSDTLQRAFTAAEVQRVYMDWNARPEPVEVVRILRRDQLTFPVMPNQDRQRASGFRYREVLLDNDQATIALEVPDTDSQRLYTFKRNGCWLLVRIVDPAFAPSAAVAAGEGAFNESASRHSNQPASDDVVPIGFNADGAIANLPSVIAIRTSIERIRKPSEIEYVAFRQRLTQSGWTPLRNPSCVGDLWGADQIEACRLRPDGFICRVCEFAPEMTGYWRGAHYAAEFIQPDAKLRLRINGTGEVDHWDALGGKSGLSVDSVSIISNTQ